MKADPPQKIYWIVTGFYITAIYAIVPVVSVLRKFLVERFGYGVYNIVYPVFIVAGFVLLYRILLRQKEIQRYIAIAGIFLTAVVYALVLPNLRYGAEKIHFLQYGFLSFLLIASFRKYFNNYLIYLWLILLIYCIGLGDEAIQGVVPDRVGEIKDVALNVFSGIIGLFIIATTIPSWRPALFFDIRTVPKLLYLSIVSIILTVLFITFIHGFGFRIDDRGTGSFYSAFDTKTLLSLNNDLKEKSNVNGLSKKIFDDEAYRHLQQRDFYDTNKFYIEPGKYYINKAKSRNENRVLEKYYSAYLDRHWHRWKKGYNKNDSKNDLPLVSRVKSTVIMKFSFHQMLFVSLVMIGFLFIVLLLIKGNIKYQDNGNTS